MHTISAGHFQCVSGHSSLLGQNITRKEHAFQLNCGTNVLKITVILTFLSWMDVDNGHGKVNVNGQCREDNSIALTCALMNVLEFKMFYFNAGY